MILHTLSSLTSVSFSLQNCPHDPPHTLLPYLPPAGGKPLVVADPTCATSVAFMELGASVVREVAKMSAQVSVWGWGWA